MTIFESPFFESDGYSPIFDSTVVALKKAAVRRKVELSRRNYKVPMTLTLRQRLRLWFGGLL